MSKTVTSSSEEYTNINDQLRKDEFHTIERQVKYRTENGRQAAEYERSEAEYRRDCMLTREESFAEQVLQESAQLIQMLTREESFAEQVLQESAQLIQYGKAKAQYAATIANQTAEFRKFNLQKFNNKIHYESGEFTIANYMVGKLVAFPDEQEIIDLTGSLEEQDDW